MYSLYKQGHRRIYLYVSYGSYDAQKCVLSLFQLKTNLLTFRFISFVFIYKFVCFSVCPAYKEPMPGWVDSLNGPVGLMLGAGKGVIRTMLCDGTLIAQVVPVDTAINALIAIGMIEGSKTKK